MIKLKIALCMFFFGFICFACGGSSNPNDTISQGDRLGAKVYRKNCFSCHGMKGKATRNGALPITTSTLELDERILLIKNGRGLMTAFKGILSDKEIKAVAEYTFTL